ncbi:helix-turn-helix transcriptional regulator [Myxococcota bacterium]|nr:helix-turn-helix transcriptional regulator [Myxococcota bacterium]
MGRAGTNRKASAFGRLLRDWRKRSGQSQLALATEAGISQRYLSFVETGRSKPSREMVLRLAEALDVPLRERNDLLTAAGFAAFYRESAIGAPSLAPIERMLDFLLDRQEPFPAFLLDRRMRILRSNRAGSLAFVPFVRDHPIWREQPPNLLRLTLHPDGLRPAIVNFEEVASALLVRLARTIALSGDDPELVGLLEELRALPGLPESVRISDLSRPAPPILAVHVKSGTISFRFFSLLTSIGTPQDVTLQDLHIESFMPADAESEVWMRSRGEAAASAG